MNNPLKYTDPSGERFTLSDLISTVAIIGGTVLCFTPAAALGVALIGAGVGHFAAAVNEFRSLRYDKIKPHWCSFVHASGARLHRVPT